MFTGIIEELGTVEETIKEGTNVRLGIKASFVDELRIDESVSHNGICLTVTQISNGFFYVIAIEETLNKTNLGMLKKGDKVNLERSLRAGSRMDGHIVQGHVDLSAMVKKISSNGDSWIFVISYEDQNHLTVEKGSITVNGVSLTVVDSKKGGFSVAIIPHTYENTTFHLLENGDVVNLEFDIIGKYVSRLMDK
jgi:riboflavin synthase